MTKHYSQKDNLITIMKEISKKTPRGILNGDTQVGHITWQMYLMRDYLKLDGTPLANASTDYAELLEFAQTNNLITADTTDNSLFKYNSSTDVLTLPDYIDLVLQGGNSVEEKEAGLPNIKGRIKNGIMSTYGYTGTQTDVGEGSIGAIAYNYYENYSTGDKALLEVSIDASKSNSIYSDSVNTVQPPAITLIPQIKYRKSTTMYEQIEAVVNYSTTEKVVGTWIDGKPLYQKTYSCTSPTNIESSESVTSIPSNITVYNLSGMLVNSNGGYMPIGLYWTPTNYISAYVDTPKSNINMRVGDTAYINAPVTITIQYTKTTD